MATNTWGTLLGTWAEYLRATGAPETTIGQRTYHLGRLAPDFPRGPGTVTFDALASWLAAHDWSPNTRRAYRGSLRAFWSWLMATGRAADSPAHLLPPVKVPRGRPRPTPEAAYREALTAADDRARLAIMLAAQCGLRRSEIARVRREDLEPDLVGHALRVAGKGGHVRIVPLPAIEALYVQFRANSTADAGGRDIKAFVGRVRGSLAESRPKNLVLDLRFDIGGDIDQTRDLAREMVAAVPGRIFVLTGPYTFSAGIVFAAAMKHDGGARVTLVGEPVGDRLRFWSEGGHVCLPHSKVCFWASDGLWDLRKGCAGEPACYGDRLDARVDSLEPEIRAPLTSAAWLTGRDPGMETVRAALSRAD